MAVMAAAAAVVVVVVVVVIQKSCNPTLLSISSMQEGN
jgi:hypothetical protein